MLTIIKMPIVLNGFFIPFFLFFLVKQIMALYFINLLCKSCFQIYSYGLLMSDSLWWSQLIEFQNQSMLVFGQDFFLATFTRHVLMYQQTSYSELTASLWLSLRLQVYHKILKWLHLFFYINNVIYWRKKKQCIQDVYYRPT